jgi:sulfotransferase family protein
MKNKGSDVICIAGMHRSGTSMVAQLLNLCGLDLGPQEQLVGPNEGNPKGHFEHIGFLKIDDAILSHFGGSAADPPLLKPGWENEPSVERIVSEARLLLETFQGRSRWGWKDPRTTLLLPFWKKLIPKLRFVLCVRNPMEVAKSLEARDGMPLQQGIYLWNHYVRAAIRDTQGHPRIFTFYEDFFRDAESEVSRLVEFCGLRAPREWGDIHDAISQELRHQSASIMDLFKEDGIPPEVKLFYLGLRALSSRGFLQSVPRTDQEGIVAENLGEFFSLMEKFHDQEKTAQLQTILVERDLLLEQLVKEKESLRLSLERVERTLTWQLMKGLTSLKDRLLPDRTHRRAMYDWFLTKFKE